MEFKPITVESFEYIRPFLKKQFYRTCDFTVGGIYMWVDFFHYEYCIEDNLLFIKGYAEEAMDKISFTVPIGNNTMQKGIDLLRSYCINQQIPLMFSAVPEEACSVLMQNYSCEKVERLDNWSDYLYVKDNLVTLAGKKLQKKRNRINKFYCSYLNVEFIPISQDNIQDVREFFNWYKQSVIKSNLYFVFEEMMVDRALDNYFILNFIGGVLKVSGRLVGFTIGEVVNDTLFVHVEKANKEILGVYEVINSLFVRYVANMYDLAFVNREEDVGDEGIRRAKLSYNPIRLLYKYNLSVML